METLTTDFASKGGLSSELQGGSSGGLSEGRSKIPSEVLKANTIETLMSQNDDLMARLKVAIRRLDILENQIRHVEETNLSMSHAYEAMKDQILVYKEKDGAWLKKIKAGEEKLKNIEVEKDILQERARIAETDFAQVWTELQTTQACVARHKRYRARIRHVARLRVNSLNEEKSRMLYATNVLQNQIDEIKAKHEKQIAAKDSQIHSLRDQIINLTQSFKTQFQTLEANRAELILLHSHEKQNLQVQLENFEEQNRLLRIRTAKFDEFCAKANSLENELIASQRSKEEITQVLQKKVDSLQTKSLEMIQDLERAQSEARGLTEQLHSAEEKNHNLAAENEALKEQVNSIRHMWLERTQQLNDTVKVNENLENINLELSRKLSELMRVVPAPASAPSLAPTPSEANA